MTIEYILIGVNIGRNKNTTTDVEQDYTLGIQQFGCLADYLVINISSPNTPGLRSLQNENELKNLLTSIRKICNKISCDNQTIKIPLILLKIAPDLNENEIKSISHIIRQPNTRIDGLIISNTTISRMNTLKNEHRNETGGLSGRPLKEKALETLRLFRFYTQGQIPLIGVGGIETVEDIVERMKAGASLVQIYTSLTYSGPPLVNKLNRQLANLMKQQNIKHLNDLIGKDS
ncbi:unnamed protein product [Rotaria sordida]|uniref:Dihydroorotate dehydrogenase catalytic domain-containing protein n=1 Tax=Rotaria sordida TaxID=392033 RepID=A0A813QTF1_9BILA|nr:unnamed protein product [Rotaria sordida]CAF0772146.1 unnamed protein product [Rotaria sordida]CAF0799267.1 unnamed protein product [Rotaria sordida]CAF3555592.1 unnamed protein product [Rotaria sordida]CAF3562821.1 unnamed protein product [Rotaria sordida]